jgi:hypothetical protein
MSSTHAASQRRMCDTGELVMVAGIAVLYVEQRRRSGVSCQSMGQLKC